MIESPPPWRGALVLCMNNFSLNPALLAAAALMALLFFGGCGSGSSEESTPPSRVSPSKQSMQHPAAVTKGIQRTPGETKKDEALKPVRDRERHASGAKAQTAQRNGSEGQRTPAEKVGGRVKELLAGTGGGGKQVVASPKAIRKAIEELKEGSSQEDPKGSSTGGVTEAIEEVLGH